MLTATDIYAVIVTYEPESGFFEHIQAIRHQVGGLVVVDNGSASATKQKLVTLATDGVCTLLHSTENNLAKAQNMGIALAKQAGATAVLLLDDDSVPEAMMVQTLVDVYNRNAEQARIGLIAPHMIDRQSQREIYYAVPTRLAFKRIRATGHAMIWDAFNIIASGSLIPLAVLDDVGGMDESYVIDYIDKEFCLRLLSHGYHTLVVSDAKLLHAIGQSVDHQLLGQRITTTNHSPLRRYYIYRNRLRTCARYFVYEPAFVLHDLMAIGYDLLRICLYESSKTKKLIYMLSGVWDACLGKSGYKA